MLLVPLSPRDLVAYIVDFGAGNKRHVIPVPSDSFEARSQFPTPIYM